MKYEYVIFDLDGTILDSLDDILSNLNKALLAIGVNYQYNREEGAKLLGDGALSLCKKVFRRIKISIKSPIFDEFLEVYYNIYKTNQGTLSKLYDGIPELIDILISKGIKVAVYSNKPENVIHGALEGFIDTNKFEFILGQKEEYEPKPDTKAILEMVDLYKIDLSKTLYVGDSDVDILLSKNLGIDSCGCVYGYRSRKELVKTGATFVIDTPLDLIDNIK